MKAVLPAIFAVLTAITPPVATHAPEGAGAPIGTKVRFKTEKLYYDISYLGIKAGSATIELKPGQSGRIYSEARSEPWIDSVYPVRNFISCDFKDGDLQRYQFNQSEGKRRKNRETLFNRQGGTAAVVDHIGGKFENFSISRTAMDPMTAFFAVRWQPLTPGGELHADVFDFGKHYTCVVKVLRRQNLDLEGKRYETIVINPRLMSDGIFSSKGDIFVYLTDDSRRLPVLVEAKILVGTVKARLTRAD